MSESLPSESSGRLASLDAYRGFVMLAMASAGLGIGDVAGNFPDSQVWQALEHQFEHVAWRGCALWDLIQPSFLFIVGVAMPFSYASRKAHGDPWSRQLLHALRRSLILIALGLFLASAASPRTNFSFTNVLAQIGLGYTFVFLFLGRRPWVQVAAAVSILVADWLLFALAPIPEGDRFESWMSLTPGWRPLEGFSMHWEKHINIAAIFDHWFLNRFPRPDGKPFMSNEGGYTTLNFFPSMATMLFGLIAGGWLRSPRPQAAKIQTLAIVGTLAIVVGIVLDDSYCPIVKRIWTPSWVVYSTGWTCWLLTAFYAAIDVAGYRRWAYPVVVAGRNSIALYLMAQLLRPFVLGQLKIHLGQRIFDIQIHGANYAPIAQSVAFLVVLWLIVYAMDRHKIYLKI